MTIATARWAWLIPTTLAATATTIAANHADPYSATVWTLWACGSAWLSGFATAATPAPTTLQHRTRR